MTAADTESERCLLRSWSGADAERAFDLYRRWEVARWLGTEPRAMTSVEEGHALVDRWAEFNRDNPIARRWAVERKSDGVVAGTVLLVPLPDGEGEFEVGWHLHPDSWGQGLATESAQTAVSWGFDHGLKEIFAVVTPGNDNSVAVCGRLGMAELGRTTKYYGGAEFELFRVTA